METMAKRVAIKCKKCGTVVFSRTGHDFRWCKCKSVAIDGGNRCVRVSGKFEDIGPRRHIDTGTTEAELYRDWNKRIDKFGLIEAKKGKKKCRTQRKSSKK